MELAKKQAIKAELSAIKALIISSSSAAAGLSQTTYPVAGPVVNIHTLPMAAQAFKIQADCMEKLAKLVEKVIDES